MVARKGGSWQQRGSPLFYLVGQLQLAALPEHYTTLGYVFISRTAYTGVPVSLKLSKQEFD